MLKMQKSVKNIVTGVQDHVSDSYDSWKRVEGRRFFVLCFAIVFLTAVGCYFKIRYMSTQVMLLRKQVEILNGKIDILVARKASFL